MKKSYFPTLLVVFSLLIFVQCQNQNNASEISQDKVEALAEKALSPGDESDFKLFLEEFKSLSKEELDLFFDKIAEKGELKRPESERYTDQEREELKIKRQEFLDESISRYGVPFNKLTQEQAASILD